MHSRSVTRKLMSSVTYIQKPTGTPSHEEFRGGVHQDLFGGTRIEFERKYLFEDRTLWLTVLSPLRGYASVVDSLTMG